MIHVARQSGFTLVELMIGIAVLGILIALATPSYRLWIANSRVRSTSEPIQNGLRLARNQAVDLALPVRFELVSATGANWIVCVPANAAATCSGLSAACSANTRTSCILQQYVSQAVSNGVRLGTATGTGGAFSSQLSSLTVAGVTFDALGRPTDYNNTSLGRIDVYSTAAGARRLVDTINASGSVRECDANLPLTANTPEGCT